MQPGQQVGLAAQDGRVEQKGGQGGSQQPGRTGGDIGEEAAEGGQQQAFVSQALGAEGADETEDVVDGEVVGEPFVGDRVRDEGVAVLTDAGQSFVQFRAPGLAEVVALVVAVAASLGQPSGSSRSKVFCWCASSAMPASLSSHRTGRTTCSR